MSIKDKKLAKVLELASVQGAIEQLKKDKTWGLDSGYYRRRLRALEIKEAELEDALGLGDDDERDDSDVEKITFTLKLPEKFLKNKKSDEDYVQYLKRTIFVE